MPVFYSHTHQHTLTACSKHLPGALQLRHHPIFQRLSSIRDSRVFTRGREMAEDMRERWETSDSAMVQRIQVHPSRCFLSIDPSVAWLAAWAWVLCLCVSRTAEEQSAVVWEVEGHVGMIMPSCSSACEQGCAWQRCTSA